MSEPTTPLSRAGLYTPLVVTGFDEGLGMQTRVSEMGLHVGANLEIKQRTAAALVVRHGSTRLGIGSDLAQRILVKVKAHAETNL